jgi:hypothetical protein
MLLRCCCWLHLLLRLLLHLLLCLLMCLHLRHWSLRLFLCHKRLGVPSAPKSGNPVVSGPASASHLVAALRPGCWPWLTH